MFGNEWMKRYLLCFAICNVCGKTSTNQPKQNRKKSTKTTPNKQTNKHKQTQTQTQTQTNKHKHKQTQTQTKYGNMAEEREKRNAMDELDGQ